MISGTKFEQGEIVLVPYPFTDLSEIKNRPVLIISNNMHNVDSEDIVTCGVTSNLKNSEFSILVDNKDIIKGSIPIKSRIKTDKIFTLKQNLVKKKIAKVNDITFEKVKQEIIKLLN